ncbi:carboxypeptidase regulatory-like domain-containing protein [Leptolyngbya sp. 7M]|uniref:carboxypeptidase regulatory-like domain-containing protein n=1 Tax=Leptolyngbya sp. 7M TaxID=2812896 RepID=UPI001B8AF7D7|nr:carboxypeptidase regulatory-like domain-containing protein [Leptolyngbya sp. 7M]QYO65786.1 carboxypeptidase regulatory-like domain-containing protein [Leptolyngbya sp. 7M]
MSQHFRSICFSLLNLILTNIQIWLLILASASVSFAIVVPGTGTGAIPDGSSPNPTCGAPRNVLFNVSGAPWTLGSISVSFTMTHTYIGDLQVFLISPDGTTASLFTYVGRTPPVGSGFGDSSNLSGTYVFSDAASGNIWVAATGGGDTYNIPPGSFRAQAPGPFSPISPGPPFISLNSTFSSIPTLNGVWTLRFLDCAAADTGSVTAASLTILGPTAAGASLSGRVASQNGTGIRNVTVSLFGGGLEAPLTTTTNSFGYYSFSDVPAGQTYIITASSKRHSFYNPTQVVTLDGDLSDLDFIAEAF